MRCPRRPTPPTRTALPETNGNGHVTSHQLERYVVGIHLISPVKLGLFHPVAVLEQRHPVLHSLPEVVEDCHGVFFLPNRFSKSASLRPIRFSNSFSLIISIPSSWARTDLLPASSPTTTKLVFFDTLLPGLPP